MTDNLFIGDQGNGVILSTSHIDQPNAGEAIARAE